MKNVSKMFREGKLARISASMAALGLLVFATLPASAATSTGPGNGLRISPVRTDLTINPGQSQTVNVTVTNVTSAGATLQTVVNDFTASPDESGNPAIILDTNKFAPKHSLKRYIGPVPKFDLPPGGQKNIPIVINIPKNASAGGYFGAIRFAPANSGVGPGQNLSLAGSVGSLILVKVPGDLQEQVSIASFDARHKDNPNSVFFSPKDITATIRLQNEGNVQEAPFGKVLLKNRSGKTLGTYELNSVTPPANVLPDSIRKFQIGLDKVKGFGQYKLEGNFGYGNGGQLLSASTTFYVIPKSVIIIFVLIVLLLLFLVFGLPRLIRRYNAWVLSRAGRTLSKKR
jgi:hypothetical protein